MSGVEAGLLKLGQAVASYAVRSWLADRRRRDEHRLPLAELVNRRVTDGFVGRRFIREVESMADAIAERMIPLAHSDRVGLPEHERLAALDAVVDAFVLVAGDDEVLFAADVDADKLTGLVLARAQRVPRQAGLGERAYRLYEMVLAECCQSYVQAVVTLGPFTPRATVELLGRLTSQSEQLARILSRLPVRTLDAPAGTAEDAEFRRRYLDLVSTGLDEVVLFGVSTRHRRRLPLSLAYVSLNVQVTSVVARRESLPDRVRPPAGTTQDVSMRVEQALSRASRTLIHGEAGSGKTTILHWLAVTAARARFAGALVDWNGCVPFLVRLRTFVDHPLPRPEQLVDGVGDTIAALMPSGWVHRVLATGRGLLLVDGVDELPAPRRAEVRNWLQRLVVSFPAVNIVVTARPAATTANWLRDQDFATARIEPMHQQDVRGLVGHWYRAVRDAPDLPCSSEQLPAYESALLARLAADSHLQALATSPLLCAMLCALNLDRSTYLPRNRMALYAAAVEMLLERRDQERRVLLDDFVLSGDDRLRILQHLAWRLSVNNATETGRAIAVARIGDKIAGMPQVMASAEEVYSLLLHRSGLIREPVEGRVDFVHRTFQEYLTAREAAEQGDVGLLIDKAHLDTWRPTVIMAVGHANGPVRTELLTGILDRTDAERRHRRNLTLVAAAAMETLPSLEPPELLDRLHNAIGRLVPPRATAEARSLAAVGEPILRRLPTDLAGLSDASAVATVRTAALVHGDEALRLLAGYASDERHPVQRELARAWDQFDPHEFADTVLADAPLVDGDIDVHSVRTALAAQRLTRLAGLAVFLNEPVDLTELTEAPELEHLALYGGATGGLSTLDRHPILQWLQVTNEQAVSDPDELPGMPMLTWLFFEDHPGIERLDFLTRNKALTLLSLSSVAGVEDFSALDALSDLTQLALGSLTQPVLSRIPRLEAMRHLALHKCVEPVGGLESVVRHAPNVSRLELTNTDWVADLTPITGLTKLTRLCLRETEIEDLTPLALLPQLHSLDLIDCPNIRDLSPLSRLPNLQWVWVRNTNDIDLGSFEANSVTKPQERADSSMLGRSFARDVLARQRPIVELRPR
jgi:NACHT domain